MKKLTVTFSDEEYEKLEKTAKNKMLDEKSFAKLCIAEYQFNEYLRCLSAKSETANRHGIKKVN